MFNKKSYIQILESKQYNQGDLVFIHHPITQDIVKCPIKETKIDKVLLCFDENSDYYGQPEFWFKKIHIIGKA